MRGSLWIWLLALIVFAVFATTMADNGRVGVSTQGKFYGIGRAPCLNAFGHHPQTTIELRIGEFRGKIVEIPRSCSCSLCRTFGLSRK